MEQGSRYEGWIWDAFDQSSDLTVVMGADTVVRWVGSVALARLMGYRPDEVVGRSMVEFLHPDDLARAAEVAELAVTGQFDRDTPITPALYRLRHARGHWVHLEVNAATTPPGELLVTIRQTHDLVLSDRLLESVTGGSPFEDQLDLVLELGRWRHPTEGYALVYGVPGGRASAACGLADPVLHGDAPVDDPTPWGLAAGLGRRLVVEDLGDPAVISPHLARAARTHGFVAVSAMEVADPSELDDACIVVWTTPEGPAVTGQRYPIENMVRALSLILEWRSHLQRLERAAHVDALTELLARSRFLHLAGERLDAGAPAGFYIDLDGFKEVNDRFGHLVGDLVLNQVGRRLAGVVGTDALLGRLGGDEFGVICPDGASAGDVEKLAEMVVTAMRDPFDAVDGTVQIGASVGVAFRRDGEPLSGLLERADQALLETKAAGKDHWRVSR